MVFLNPSKFVLQDESCIRLSSILIDMLIEMIKANLHRKGIVITDHNFKNVIKISA
jgi:ABC-type lipopolysaccharide export system ATPase subunit